MLSSIPVLRRPVAFGALVVLALVAGMMSGVSQAQPDGDNIVVIEAGNPSNEQITARLSRLTANDARTVLVASSDNGSYADSLASAGLQDLGPLLVLDDIPEGQVIPDFLATELLRLSVDRVIVLGGEAAVSESTVDAIERAGYETQRVAGPTRIETAIEVARVGAAGANRALMVRGFGSDEATDPTQGWVDALSSGPLALDLDAPILLTQQETLTSATAAYLDESGITEIIIIGGTAAVSETVETQLLGLGYGVFRIAGTDRVDTALEINAARGVLDSPGRSIVVDGFADNGWVGGFASARHAAQTRGAILPAQGDQLPPAVAALVQANPTYEVRPVTCVVALSACEQIDPDIRVEPTDTSTDTPTPGTTEPPEPNTDAVVLSSLPAAGTVLEPFVAPNIDDLLAQGEAECENEEGLDPDSEEFAECVADYVDDNQIVDRVDDVAPFNAMEFRIDDPLGELQNELTFEGSCVMGATVAIPESFVSIPVEDDRPRFYVELQNDGPVPSDQREPPLGRDPSGPCVMTVTSPLASQEDDADDGESEFYSETVAFELDSYLANFRIATPVNAPSGQVTFQDDSWGLANDLTWDFGDGTTATADGGSITVHTYDQPGEYNVTLTITAASRDAAGDRNQTSITRVVEVE